MEKERQERIYKIILRMVLWGEPRDKVFRTLETNGFTGKNADVLFNKAFKERVESIRATCYEKLLIGFGAIAAGLLLFMLHQRMIDTTGLAVRYLFYTAILISGFGVWRFIDSLIGILHAPKKKGSIVED